MDRYPLTSYGKKKLQKWIYSIAGLLVIGLVLLFVYIGPFGSDSKAVEPQQIEITEIETKPVKTIQKPEPVAVAEPEVVAGPVIVEKVAEAPPQPDKSQASIMIEEALACLRANPPRFIECRDRLNDILISVPMNAQTQLVVKEQLKSLADKWLFGRTIFPGDYLCEKYTVQPGDLLITIGEKYKIPYEIIMELNNISKPESLQAGQILKVAKGPFNAVVDKSDFTLDLYLQKTYVGTYKVGLGKEGMGTPTGTWLVKPGGKMIQPRWTDPVSGRTYDKSDPDYPLGSRWIALEGIAGDAVGREGFAIHGTKDPNSIGTASSQGCIRLYNGEVVFIYKVMMEGFSRIEVVD